MPLADSHDELSDLFEEVIPQRQSIIKTDSEDSLSDDEKWEEVDLQPFRKEQITPDPENGDSKNGDTEELTLVLKNDDEAATHMPKRVARKPLTSGEKELRLNIHKTHLCCLLAHIFMRNYWCNDESLHPIVRRNLNKKTISYLHPKEGMSQFQRSRSFMDGLEQASEVFRQKFKIDSRGISRPFWAENANALATTQQPADVDLPMLKEDFKAAVQQFKASRDVGAQLFCALLRSVGVDTRLVCSLQVLPFNSNSPPATSMQPKYAEYYPAELMQSRRHSPESCCPVYWVEAFNEAAQKWIPVDPLVTKSIAKSSRFEPSANDQENKLTYVVAFEEDGSAHDVTRRYAKSYNAKTRKDRVENTKGGEKWWRRAMKLYQRHYSLDRDQVDEAELSRKEAAEPMPRNVQDFKYHPYYALERHLRRHEVIYPKREVGKVGAGRSGGRAVSVPIFRRQDVHQVQSADKWYRKMGREINIGEQPLKRIPARKTRDNSIHSDDEVEENAGTSLYAMHQTKPYTAPPVANGRVPKNIYGNIDIYVATMIPPGGSHIKHPDTVRAAKILGIDFAEAITGFVFRGRHGTAVSQGAVIASEHYDAVEAVLSTLDDERIQAEEAQRSREAQRMWKRFLAGLRIRERIEGYTIEGERDTIEPNQVQIDEDEENQSDQGGGFFPAQEAGNFAEPTSHRIFRQQDRADFVANEDDERVVHNADDQSEGITRQARDRFLDNLDDDDGGGFLVEDEQEEEAEGFPSTTKVDAKAHSSPPVAPSHHSPILQATLLSSEQEDIPHNVDANMSEVDGEINETAQEKRPTQHGFGSGLTQAELDEARLLQQLHESQQLQSKPPDNEEPELLQTPPPNSFGEDKSEAVEYQPNTEFSFGDAATAKSPTPAPLTAPPVVESPKSDKGSLLSEDPEDEDAEPDWLI